MNCSLRNIKIHFTWIFIFVAYHSDAQQFELKDSLLYSNVRQLYFDQDDNLYILQPRELLKMRYPNKTAWSCQTYDDIHNFSVINRHKIYLLTDNSLMILNQQLTPTNENLIFDEKPVAVSEQQLVFILDEISLKLTAINPLTQQDYFTLSLDKEPLSIAARSKRVFVLNEDGVMVYNDLGQKIRFIKIIGDCITETLNDLFVVDKGFNKITSLISGETVNIPFEFETIAIGQDKMAISREDKIYIYGYKN